MRRPPTRSATQPQICCAITPAPSCSDSMAAPDRAPTPISPQKATMWASGMDIVTQQQKMAADQDAHDQIGRQALDRAAVRGRKGAGSAAASGGVR